VMTHPILQQLLYTERSDDSFFCVTKTEYEVSIVIEDKHMQEMQQYIEKNKLLDCIEVWPQNWIALRTDLGSSGAGNNESVVNSLAKALSGAGITIFYLSTYSSDYCLVEEQTVGRALQVLRSEFKLIIEGEDMITSIEKLKPKETIEANIPAAPVEVTKRKLFFHSCDLKLACISPSSISDLSVFLMQCLFFERSEICKIISFIQIEGEISLLGDDRFFKELPSSLAGLLSEYSETWKAFSIGEQPLGYSESGIVHSISSPLAACNTSIFYMSTFRTDYCLVIASDIENSLHTLKNHFLLENKRD